MFGLMNLLFDQGHIVLAEHRVMFHNFICLYTNVYVGPMYNFIKRKIKRGNAVWYNILSHCNVCVFPELDLLYV